MGDMKELEKLMAKERREWRECQADAKIGKIVKDALGKLTGQIEENLRAEMLDDDAREKFLGKAEPKEPFYNKYDARRALIYRPGKNVNAEVNPPFPYLLGLDYINIAAFRDEDTRDRVLEFLNADAAEDERIDRLLIQLKELLAKG